jgi:tryptophan-rich sensory protein
MSITALICSLAACFGSAALEGLAAGRGVKQRFAELRMPAHSPSLGAWIAIGVLYYVVCGILLYRVISGGLAGPSAVGALVLTILVMICNAGWNWLFFRRKDLRVSFLAFFPYGALVLALTVDLFRVDLWAAAAVTPYLLYLPCATWWGYRLWRLNG